MTSIFSRTRTLIRSRPRRLSTMAMTSPQPVCLMNAGYSAGWCEVSFGIDLKAEELTCRAKGDERCVFVMAHPKNFDRLKREYQEKAGVRGMTEADEKITRLTASLEDAQNRLRRRGEALESLVLITRTFVSLSLTERTPICDTLISLLCSTLGARHGVVLLASGPDATLVVEGASDVDASALSGPAASALWAKIMRDRVARSVVADEVRTLWPEAPAWLRNGGVAVAIDIRDQAVGLVLMTHRISGQGFHDEDLELISAAVTVAAMALTNAELHATQETLLNDVERQAREARLMVQQREKALKELDEKLAVIETQRVAIRELSTPILEIWKDVIALPIVGNIDAGRSSEMTERLLSAITTRRARFVILDITGVDRVDEGTADHLIRMVQAARIVGARCVVTGVQPAVAETLVSLGQDLSSVVVLRTLQDALKDCLRRMGASL